MSSIRNFWKYKIFSPVIQIYYTTYSLDLQSLKYLLSDPLKKKFVNSYSWQNLQHTPDCFQLICSTQIYIWKWKRYQTFHYFALMMWNHVLYYQWSSSIVIRRTHLQMLRQIPRWATQFRGSSRHL